MVTAMKKVVAVGKILVQMIISLITVDWKLVTIGKRSVTAGNMEKS